MPANKIYHTSLIRRSRERPQTVGGISTKRIHQVTEESINNNVPTVSKLPNVKGYPL